MGPSPAPLQVCEWTAEVGEHIDVGQIGADNQGGGAEGGSPAQTAGRQRRASQRVADRIYSSLASSSSLTFPSSAVDAGQPCLAASAIRAVSALLGGMMLLQC